MTDDRLSPARKYELLQWYNKANIQLDEDISDDEKIGMAEQMQQMGVEFAADEIHRGGPSLAPYVNQEGQDSIHISPDLTGAYGEYLPSDAVAYKRQDRYNKHGIGLLRGKDHALEGDDIVLYADGLGNGTVTHELYHRRDNAEDPDQDATLAHISIYAEMLHNARYPLDKEEAYDSFNIFVRSSLGNSEATREQTDKALDDVREVYREKFDARDAKAESQMGLLGRTGREVE